jgi:hypothetical protein
MKKNDQDLQAENYLRIHGVSKKTLEAALKFYEDIDENRRNRGRPDNEMHQIMVFLLYYDAIVKRGFPEKKVTNKWLARNANLVQAKTLELFLDKASFDDPKKLMKTKITESSVKQWRSKFRNIREFDIERFNKMYEILKSKDNK